MRAEGRGLKGRGKVIWIVRVRKGILNAESLI